MRADTQSISIDARAETVRAFVAEPENLPRWAVGFAKGITKSGDRWIVKTGGGEVGLEIETDGQGVVDFVITPAPGVTLRAASRVIPRGSGAEYVFTQFQADGMNDEVFDKNVHAVRHELAVLKALLEVECPL